MPSKPEPAAHRFDQNEEAPASQEELEIIRERLKTFDEDVKAARPWPEVKARILSSRKPTR
jgi:hypothetical protein